MSDYIYEDALIEILKYLPARNIVRLRSVCKSWKELIDSDELMLKHLALQKPSFLVEYGNTKFDIGEIGCQPLTHAVRCPIQGDMISFLGFYGTHHGIVCFDEGGRNISLWNPSTGKLSSVLLPVDFGFDRLSHNWDCCKSFCIDPFTREYRIIIVFFKDIGSNRVTANGILYSSTGKNWSAIPEQKIGWGGYFGRTRRNLLLEGVAYWSDDFKKAVLSFDFNQKTLELIKFPIGKPTFGDPLDLIQWKGAFSVLCCAPNSDDTYEIQTWTEGSWVSVFRFKLPSHEPSARILAMAETDERFWVLYDIYNDMLREQTKHRGERCTYADLLCNQPKQQNKGLRWMYCLKNYHDLCLYEIGVGCTRLASGVDSALAFNFVESLLFPLT